MHQLQDNQICGNVKKWMLDFKFEIKSLVNCAASLSALLLADSILSESSISKVLCKTIRPLSTSFDILWSVTPLVDS